MAMARWALTLLILLALGLEGVLGRDFYEILQVGKGASDAQIKRSYRKLALQYHPDKVTGTDDEKAAAAKKFADINNAYETLSDPEKRKIYDRYGEEGLKQHAAQQGGGGGGPGSMFADFFGGFGGFGGFGFGQGEEEERVQKGHDVYVELFVTLKDLYLGKEFKVTRDKSVIKPAAGTRKCKCKQKLVTRQLGPGMFQQYTTQVCEDCPAVRLEREQEELTVHVEPGMANGHQIAFFEEGEPLVDGEPGDLKFVVRTLPNKRWERRGKDLLINETISLVDALTGFTREVEHLDGHKVKLSATGVTQHNDFHHIVGEGMPVYESTKRGDLWVQYWVEFPESLTEEQKAAVRKIFPDKH